MDRELFRPLLKAQRFFSAAFVLPDTNINRRAGFSKPHTRGRVMKADAAMEISPEFLELSDSSRAFPKLIRFARQSPREQYRIVRKRLRYHLLNVGVPHWRVPHAGTDRTAYVIGLFGAGRWYINQLLWQNIGDRAIYFRDMLRCHPGPTSMIYSGHATLRYVSSLQDPPATTSLLLDAVRAGVADSIFIRRHPLDSLLTNWVWWRTYIRSHRMVAGISQIYKNRDNFCADLDRNFPEFRSFAEGDPGFFAAAPGLRFLSFSEFVEETELHLPMATLALRFEDFMADPAREFSRIAAVMSVDLDSKYLRFTAPLTGPYGYLAVREKVPRFRAFVESIDADTKRRIDRIGYEMAA